MEKVMRIKINKILLQQLYWSVRFSHFSSSLVEEELKNKLAIDNPSLFCAHRMRMDLTAGHSSDQIFISPTTTPFSFHRNVIKLI